MYRQPSFLQRAFQRVKWPAMDFLHAVGLKNKLLKMRPGAVIVALHNIDATGNRRFNSRFISEAEFESHLQWLVQNCNLLTQEQFWKKEFDPHRLNVTVGFDDGLANNYHRALPLLKKYKVPATFYVTPLREAGYDILWPDLLDLVTRDCPAQISIAGETFVKNNNGIFVNKNTHKTLRQTGRESNWEFICQMTETLLPFARFRNDAAFDDYWKLLTDAQIAEMANTPGITIGAHGLHHCGLANLSDAEAIAELQESKEILGRCTGMKIHSFAYPDGSYTRRTVDLAEQAGYTMQLASEFFYPEDVSDNRLRERFSFNPYISLNNQRYALLRGKYF